MYNISVMFMKNNIPYGKLIGREVLQYINDRKKISQISTDNIKTQYFVIGKRGAVPCSEISSGTFSLPTYTIAANPCVTQDEAKQNPNIKSHVRERSLESIDFQEEKEVFKILKAGTSKTQMFFRPKIGLNELNEGMAILMENAKGVANIVCSWSVALSLSKSINLTFDFATQSQKIGFYNGIPIYVTSACTENSLYILPSPELLGVICSEPDNIEECNDTRRLREGWVISREIGLCVMDDKCSVHYIMGQDPTTITQIGISKNYSLSEPEEIDLDKICIPLD